MLNENQFLLAKSGISGFESVIKTNQSTPSGCTITEHFYYRGLSEFNFTNYQCNIKPVDQSWCLQFVQIMWISTERMGCSFQAKKPEQTIPYNSNVLCIYEPPGNIPGKYLDNIPLLQFYSDKPKPVF